LGFYPLGEVIDSDDKVFALREFYHEWSEDVHAPPGKRPRRGQRFQLVRWS
ncbi:hypothetical protein A2U01_0086468, partial [Trifolium medium]|nr:hypothetical protein [Trifolium medium]